MTTKNNTTEIAVTETAHTNEIAVSNQHDLDLSSFLDESEGLDQLEEKIILTPQGISLDKVGESFSAIFMGYSTMTIRDNSQSEEGELKEIPAVQFLMNKQMRFNGGVSLVNQFRRINLTQGAKVRVTYTEKDKNTKIYSVSLLG
jgi:hypothetical protein